MKGSSNRYVVNLEYDDKDGEIAELIETFTHPNGRLMHSLLFEDRQLKGYFSDEIEPLIKLIK